MTTPTTPTTPDPDRPCRHEDFAVFAEVNRVTAGDDDPTVVAFSVDIRIDCAQCGEPFRWTGLQPGLSRSKPMCNVDETELRAPIRPSSADPGFGTGLPGFAVFFPDSSDESQ